MRTSGTGPSGPPSAIRRVFASPWAWIGLSWIVGLGLGYIGLQRYAGWNDLRLGPVDLLYLLLQLVALESGGVEPPIPWQLQIARFGLPALAGWTVVRAAMAIFWEHAMRLSLRLWRGHVIICGLSKKGFLLARDFVAEGRRVVIVEVDERHPLLDQMRQIGALVLTGDATDPLLLQQAGVGRAAALIALTGDDGINAEVAVRANAMVSRSRGDPLHCVIHIVDPAMWDLLREWSLGGEEFSGLRLDIFNIYQRGAELLLEDHPVYSGGGAALRDARRFVVVGLGNLGRYLILQSAERWYRGREDPEERLEITAVDRRASSIVANLAARFPRLTDAASIRGVDLDVDSPAFLSGEFLRESGSNPLAQVVFVCLDSDSLAFSTGLTLRRILRGESARIVLRVLEAGGLSRLISDAGPPGPNGPELEPFAVIERTCTTGLLAQGTHERLARALHESYLRSQTHSPEGGASLPPWSNLSEALRSANRRQADHIGALIEQGGCSLELLTDWGEAPLQFTVEEVEALARAEHRRWCEEKRNQGWRYAPGGKDEASRTHPDLVEWDDLPEPEKEKNRTPIRDLPALLHSAGYRISRGAGYRRPN
jgi:hypothetical protein